MADRFEGVIAQLKEEHLRLAGEKEELTSQVRAVEADMKRVTAALSALGTKPAGKNAGGRPLGSSRQQIASLVSEVLQELGTLDLDRLRSEVETRLGNKKLSRVGFASRFKEALADERFNESPAGWKLVAAEDVNEPENATANVHH